MLLSSISVSVPRRVTAGCVTWSCQCTWLSEMYLLILLWEIIAVMFILDRSCLSSYSLCSREEIAGKYYSDNFSGPSVHEAWGQLYCNENGLWLFFRFYNWQVIPEFRIFSLLLAARWAFGKPPFNLPLTALTLAMCLKKTQKHIKNNCRKRSILFVVIARCKIHIVHCILFWESLTGYIHSLVEPQSRFVPFWDTVSEQISFFGARLL